MAQSMEERLDELLITTGVSFIAGLIGGSTFHFFKSLRISPTDIPTACHAVRLNAPRVGGKFAAWNALCLASHYALVSVRQKDDRWNTIFSTAIGTGLLSVCRRSLRASARFAMGGALISAVSEVSSIVLDMHA